MPLSDKTNLLVQNYVRRQCPEIKKGLRRFIADELQRIKTLYQFTRQASIQVSDNPPASPVKEMVRYAVLLQEPIGNTFSGLVV